MKKFAFLIHPRWVIDSGRLFGKKLGIGENWGMRLLPKRPFRFFCKHANGRLGYAICSKFMVAGGRGETVEGYIITVWLTARQMVELPRKKVVDRIQDTILFMQDNLGIERVGLGAYTAPITNNGSLLTKNDFIKCGITHGDSLSAATSIPAVQKTSAMKGIDIGKCTIAVVGAYGLVGRAAALLLSELNPRKMIITGPNRNKVNSIKKEMATYYEGEILGTNNNSEIKDADIIILTTTANGTIVSPEILKKEAIVIDMAQPHNMGPEVCKARPDVLRIDGGYMAIPQVDLKFDMGPPPGTTFACLTETMTLSLLNDPDHHVGPVDTSFAKYIYSMAKNFGFSLAPLTNFSRPLDFRG